MIKKYIIKDTIKISFAYYMKWTRVILTVVSKEFEVVYIFLLLFSFYCHANWYKFNFGKNMSAATPSPHPPAPGFCGPEIHKYLVFGNEPKGAMRHKINGYQSFKVGIVKKVRIKKNVTWEKKSFLVKCLVSASIKNMRYRVNIHSCQVSGDIVLGKCIC